MIANELNNALDAEFKGYVERVYSGCSDSQIADLRLTWVIAHYSFLEGIMDVMDKPNAIEILRDYRKNLISEMEAKANERNSKD